jgi:hypothetical protein
MGKPILPLCVAAAAAITAGCAGGTDALGVRTVHRQETVLSALAGDVPMPLSDSADGGELGWFRKHVTDRGGCEQPFLVVLADDGRSADIYSDTRCRRSGLGTRRLAAR